MKKIAILGFGTVGSAVYKAVADRSQELAAAVGEPVSVRYVLNRSGLEGRVPAVRAAKSFERIVNDSEISLVVEAIGGISPAYDFIRRCLCAGKHVVTANKELISTFGPRLFELARENGVNLLFEASSGGAIPIVSAINGLAGSVQSITGVLNGTTNYILNRMLKNSSSFESALIGAQMYGYAERDPSDDIYGIDTLRKLVILSSLSFGRRLPMRGYYVEGIGSLSSAEVAFAARNGYAMRLLALAYKENSRVAAVVTPAFVGPKSPFFQLEDAQNAVELSVSEAGKLCFTGAGAGGGPTANAVLSDIVAAFTREGVNRTMCWSTRSLYLTPMLGDFLVCSDFIPEGLPFDVIDSLDNGKLLCSVNSVDPNTLREVLKAAREQQPRAYVGVPILYYR